MEFKKDKDSTRKYRNLKRWLQFSLEAGSLQEAQQIIGEKIEDYKWAIKKHGFKTITGALSSILNSKTMLSLSAGSSIAGAFGGPIWAAISAGAISISRVAIWLAERRIDLEDIKRGPNSEIAILCDAQKLVKSNK